MAQSSSRSTDFDRALGDAKKQAENVASAFSEAAQDVYGQARDSAADIAGTANEAARTTMAHSKRRSAPPSRPNPIRLPRSRLASGGCWAARTGLSKNVIKAGCGFSFCRCRSREPLAKLPPDPNSGRDRCCHEENLPPVCCAPRRALRRRLSAKRMRRCRPGSSGPSCPRPTCRTGNTWLCWPK
jgi:hypothetical protein